MDHVTYKGRTIINFQATETTYKACMTLTVQNTLIAWHIWTAPAENPEGKSLTDLQRLLQTIQLVLETALQAPWANERETTKE